MSSTPTQHHLPRDIDPRKFAQQKLTLRGNVAITALERLSRVLANTDGEVAVALEFGIDEQGLKVVNGNIHGGVYPVCQRCLEAVAHPLDIQLSLGIVWDEEEAKNLPRRLDPWLVGEGATDIYQIVEEEILLSLPMVAYHSEPCVDASLYQSGEVAEEKAKSPEDNPFKVLEQLKGSPKS